MSSNDRALDGLDVHPRLAPEELQGPTIQTLLRPAWRHRWIIVGACSAAILVGFFLAALAPNTYRSTSKVFVRHGERDQIATTLDTPGPLASADGLQNAVELLSNTELLRLVASELEPRLLLASYDPLAGKSSAQVTWFHRLQRWLHDRGPHSVPEKHTRISLQAATSALESALQIQPIRSSSVLRIEFLWHDPEVARQCLEKYLELAFEFYAGLFTSEQSYEFLQRQVRESEASLSEAQDAYLRFRRKAGIIDIDRQQETLLAEIHAVESRLFQDRVRKEQIEERIGFVDEQLASTSEKAEPPPPLRTERDNPEYSLRRNALYRLELERVELLETYPSGSTEVRSKTRQIERVQKELEDLPPTLLSEVATAPVENPVHGALTSRLRELREELAGLMIPLSSNQERLDQLRATLSEIEGHRLLLQRLQGEMELRRDMAATLARALDTLRIENSLDEARMSSFRLVQRPSLPLDKDGPNRAKLLLAAAFVGLFLGIGLAYVIAAVDRRVHDREELEGSSGLAVLASVPETRLHATGSPPPDETAPGRRMAPEPKRAEVTLP